MKKAGIGFFLTFLIFAVMSFYCSNKAVASEIGNYFEFGVGGGMSLNGINTKQMLIVPAVNMQVKGSEFLRFRIEGNMEMIDYRGKLTVISGVAPFLRAVLSQQKLRPFIEIGAGINYSNHERIGERRLGGPFFFSAMGGVGFEFLSRCGPISLSYRARHLSNGHLREVNQGLNSQYLMLSLSF